MTFENKIKDHLISKGLNKSNLEINIDNSSKEINEAITLLCNQLKVKENKIIEILSTRVMQKESIDMKNVDNLIGIAQLLNGGYISKMTLDAIHMFAKA